jgi:pyruvate decarboxylase
LGISAIHGVPGDYNLDLLDHVEPDGMLWVGNTNELNTGYTADGYARIKGHRALITTFGVGEVSAVNAIACAYAERAAVVHSVGTPPRDTQELRINVHHTLGDGDFRHSAQMQSHIAVTQVNLIDPQSCLGQIDEALKQCILHSRPVYIEVPVDVVTVSASAEKLDSQISILKPNSTEAKDEVLAQLLKRI